MVTFENITLGQYQELYAISKSEMDDLDKMTECMALISGKTARELDEMNLMEVNKIGRQVNEILNSPLPESKPQKEFNGIGINYEPGKLTRGQYVTFMHFMKGNPIENCHLLLASISYNPKTNKHESDKHKEIAEKLQEMKFIDVYSACLFFCQLFTHSIRGLEDYLIPILTETMTKEKARETLTVLMKGLDGCMLPKELQTLRA